MLALKLKVGQRLIIGDSVVKVMSVGKSQIRIGVDAPKSVRILRGEVADRINQEREAA